MDIHANFHVQSHICSIILSPRWKIEILVGEESFSHKRAWMLRGKKYSLCVQVGAVQSVGGWVFDVCEVACIFWCLQGWPALRVWLTVCTLKSPCCVHNFVCWAWWWTRLVFDPMFGLVLWAYLLGVVAYWLLWARGDEMEGPRTLLRALGASPRRHLLLYLLDQLLVCCTVLWCLLVFRSFVALSGGWGWYEGCGCHLFVG